MAECSGMGWRNRSEQGGGINRIGMAESPGILTYEASEYIFLWFRLLDENIERVILDTGLGEDCATFQDIEIALSKNLHFEAFWIF